MVDLNFSPIQLDALREIGFVTFLLEYESTKKIFEMLGL